MSPQKKIRIDENQRIVIKGAREHNLKNIDLTLPRNKLIVMTGLSGSGKSSLAFDTIYADGQRRYMESLSSYARQFLGQMEKPDVDEITGLSPAISIDQKNDFPQPALDRGHRDRNLRLSAPSVRAQRRAALPGLRAAHQPAERGRDGGRGHAPARAHPLPGAGPGRARAARAPRPKSWTPPAAPGTPACASTATCTTWTRRSNSKKTSSIRSRSSSTACPSPIPSAAAWLIRWKAPWR